MRLMPVAILVGVLSACARPPTSPPETHLHVDLEELSAVQARDRMTEGSLTSRALTAAYLERIAKIDDAGPVLNAVIEVSATALAEAERLDTERRAGKIRGLLHGIPILIKDNIDVAGMVNSAGSLALEDNRPVEDAFLVTRLRESGAVILGKTNLSEWANFRSTRSTSGWSSRGGQTKNAYVLDRNPCGSSSGTATAIAASLAAVGVGTETDGSIICPASVSALVGLKPTVGLVSRRGIIPISASQDTAGPMGRNVADVALLLNGLAAIDPQDPAGAGAGRRIPADYSTLLASASLKGKRFGVLRQAMGFHPDADAAVDRAVAAMKGLGAEVSDVTIDTYGAWDASELDVMLYEFKDGLNKYLAVSPSSKKSLEAIIAFNTANAGKVMPYFGQELFERAQAKGPLTDPAYLKARDNARRSAGQNGLLSALDKNNLDAVLAPSMSPAWPTDHLLGDHYLGAGYGIAAVAGTPSITVPMGDVRGLPLGVTLMGRAYSEPDLIAFAYVLEQSTRARKPPQFKLTLQ